MVHPSRLDSPVFVQFLDVIERHTMAIFQERIDALLGRFEASGVLRNIHVPTLLVCGRQDALSPLSRHEEMQAMVPGSRLVLVEDSGHMTTMEQLAAVTQVLLEWIQG